jgi:ketosteroid isomerase-like protein
MDRNEQVIRKAYETAEVKDINGFVSLFTEDAIIRNKADGTEYRGEELGGIVTDTAKAFPDMHRELYDFYVSGDVVVVELSLNATHTGPMEMPGGTIKATGKEIHAPCCDVWSLKNGKIQSFNCYNSATVILAQLGVLTNLQASFEH